MKNIFFLFSLLALFSLDAAAQQIITGKIYDGKARPIYGASIIELTTTNGTQSDIYGNYTLTVTQQSPTIRVSYLGYKTRDILITDKLMIDVVLEDFETNLDEVAILGTRNKNRTSTQSMAPIDVIDIKELSNRNGQLDLNQMLNITAPSFNSNRQSGSDGADHIDPASLRGLGPDQTLVLINGKRQHQSSLINLYGSRGRGNTGTDLNTIPAAAIERIEILRDGAAAQYGSDAIAGVINIILKNNVNEGALNFNAGAHQAKYRFDDKKIDGMNYNVNFNYGIKVTDDGYLNLTVDRNSRDHTNRANTGYTEYYRRQYGDAAIVNTSIYLNSKIEINKNLYVYGVGGYNKRNGEAYAWTRFADDDRNIAAIYPNGFDPLITSKIEDYTITIGAKATINKNNVFDFSHNAGGNTFMYTVANSLNRSLDLKTPTTFDAGGYNLHQNTSNASFTHYMPNLFKGSSFEVGGEYRLESYEIIAGQIESYKTYIDTLPPGSQGFPGFQPSDEVQATRDNKSVYADLEIDVTKKWSIGAALRNENYSDFGSILNWKLSTRYQILKNVAIRSTVSTGFRAPSLAQKYFNSTITNFELGQAVEVLIASNNGQVAEALGIPKLKEETSKNYSVGFTYNKGGFSFTADAYQIEIKDRVVLTGAFTSDDPIIGDTLVALNVGQAQFFTNAVNTTTQGLDVIASYTRRFKLTRVSLIAAINFNKLTINDVFTNDKLKGKEDTYFDIRERNFLIMSAPPIKSSSTLNIEHKKWNYNLRATYYGEVRLARWDNGLDVYTAKVPIDLSTTYAANKNIQLTVGINNIFDLYPDIKDPAYTEGGGAWDAVQMGTNGRLGFVKFRLNF